ncbi:MAG TPA: DoxX family membrane protein [Blastocatellia bacterium]|nr:DoxX family membrane protein [Blastocatellia bacterium]
MRVLKTIMKLLLAIFFILAGVNHFVNPDFYVKIMPPYLPFHLELVYLSAIFEIVFGAMLLIARLSRVAAWGIIAVLIGVFPANIHMAVNSHLYPEISPIFLMLRLPLQAVLIAWAYWFTRREAARAVNAAAG